MKIIIDPGHGGKDFGGGSNSKWYEKDINLKISLYQYESFKKLGIDVLLTRYNDVYINYKDRTDIITSSGADICISNHINWYSDKKVSGAEVIYSIHDSPKLSEMILNELVFEGATRRRVFKKEHPSYKGQDYYFIHRNTVGVETVIIEYGFASNEIDSDKISKDWKLYAEAVVSAVCKYIKHDYNEFLNRTKILGKSKVSLEKMKQWAKRRGATQKFIDAADYYFKYGILTGIRSDILYCQSAKETNFGKYTGIVKESMNNFAGIKISNPKGDNIEDFERFETIEDGVRAHFNHMAAYIGIEPIGKTHGRYSVVKKLPWSGEVRFVKELSYKWASDKNYGESILLNYLSDLINFSKVPNDFKILYEEKLKENQLLEDFLRTTYLNQINIYKEMLSMINNLKI